jgi:hypothetical protein
VGRRNQECLGEFSFFLVKLYWRGRLTRGQWIDRAGGVCGFYGTQILGMAEKMSGEMLRKFQIAVYEKVNAEK